MVRFLTSEDRDAFTVQLLQASVFVQEFLFRGANCFHKVDV